MPTNSSLKAAAQERLAFSSRLQETLKKAGYAPDSPTQLAREFNARNMERSITIHAARKWLVGEAIPTQEKLRLLADWLGVHVNWLRFGSEESRTTSKNANSQTMPALNRVESNIIQNLHFLDNDQQELMLKLVLNLAKLNNKAKLKVKKSA